MKKNIYRILLISLASIFLLQAISKVTIIPIKFIISWIGQTENPLKLFFSGLIAIIIVVIISILIEVLYSIGFKKESGLISQKKVFVQGIIAFITVWLTFFTYSLLSIAEVVPKIVMSEQLLNIYLFWFLFINAFVKISEKRPRGLEGSDIIDKNRITWLSHITGLNKAEEFKGEKGAIVYKQKVSTNIGYLIMLIVSGSMISPIFILTGKAAFSMIPINPPEVVSGIRILFGYIFFIINIALLGLLGLTLSRRIIVYNNSIELPLSTISDEPFFTVLLPRSRVILGIDDIVSYKLEKKRSKNSNEYYLNRVILNMRNGDVIITKPTMFNPDEFEKIFISTLGKEKKYIK